MQWGRYNSDFVLGSRPYVAAVLIGATSTSYNVSLYAAVPDASVVNQIPVKAMIMTGSNFTDFQVGLQLPPTVILEAVDMHAFNALIKPWGESGAKDSSLVTNGA